MLNKELLLVNCVPFIEFQGITFELKAAWGNYTGTWPGSNSWIKPDPVTFIIDNVEYTITGIYIDKGNSYIKISPSAKTAFAIRMQNRSFPYDAYGDFSFSIGATQSSFIKEEQFYLPMSAMQFAYKYEILSI